MHSNVTVPDGCALWWVRDDMRIADNEALGQCVASGLPVIAVHCDTPPPEGARREGAAAQWWIARSLEQLAASLRDLGIPLLTCEGDARTLLPELTHRLNARVVRWQRRYHLPWCDYDAQVKDTLREAGVDVHSTPGFLLHEPWQIRNGSGQPFQVYTPYSAAALAAPERQPVSAPDPQQLRSQQRPLLDDDAVAPFLHPNSVTAAISRRGYLPTPPTPMWTDSLEEHWDVSEAGAQAALADFCATIADYDTARDIPSLPGTSRLSPYFARGLISPAQAWQASLQAGGGGVAPEAGGHAGQSLSHSAGQSAGASTWRKEVLWREFAWHRLAVHPDMAHTNIRSQFDFYPWSEGSEVANVLHAWQRGRTGIPLVDAGMRELWHTGYMHNRVRMVAASFLVKNCGVHWRQGEAWFWDTLVDADPASNPFGWQWVAGCGDDAAPYFRIFNPLLQAKRFDPNSLYIRRWVPEYGTPEYPAPCVDVAQSRRDALAMYKALPPRS